MQPQADGVLAHLAEQLLGAAVRSSSHVKAGAAHGRIATVAAEPPVKLRRVVVQRSTPIDDPTDDCNILGLQGCQSQSLSLEYVVWASPFSPN